MIFGLMEYIFDSETLQFLWSALRETASAPNQHQAERLSKRIIKKGWAFKSDVEDLLYSLDSRLDYSRLDVKIFSQMLEIHWEPVSFRPNAKSKYISELDAIRAEDAALLLIILERVGFQVEPAILVDSLLPRFKSRTKQILNNAELEIMWFRKMRHKCGTIILKTDNKTDTDKEIDIFKTLGKYKISVRGAEVDKPEQIEILSPKFREQRNPVPVTCQQCGLQWFQGDPDSSSNHRREHKRRMLYLDPKPSKEMLEERKTNDAPELVTSKSPPWKHKEMYVRALAFKREFNYDFVQWQGDKGDSDPCVHGFLFTDESGSIVGACSFRRRKKKESEHYWELDWIWICPKERRKGHLSSRWKALRSRFGNFCVAYPVSDDMKAFLAKQGDSSLLDV